MSAERDSYESLRNAKAALDEGLISGQDFDEVKTAFLRAQQIKAGLDAGFIRESDYQNIKRSFLNSLNLADPTVGSVSNFIQSHPLPNSSPAKAAHQPAPNSHPEAPAHDISSRKASGVQQTPVTQADNGSRQPRQNTVSGNGIPGRANAGAPAGNNTSRVIQGAPANIPKVGGARPKQTGSTSMSGISVAEDAVNLYYYLKAKSAYRWAMWKINDAGNQVIIAQVGEKDSTYQEFVSAFPPTDCRYGVIDMQFTNSEGCIFNKIVFINWAPDASKIKSKMMYASTKDFFKSYLDGLSLEIQGGDLDDISEEEATMAVRGSVTRQ